MTQLVPLTEDRVDDADRLLRAAFGLTASRRPAVERNLALQPDGWFLAVDGSRPVGIGGIVSYGRYAYIGGMAVLPDRRRRGVGSLLLEHLLDWNARRGCEVVVLDASDAGAPLYARYGFVDDDTLVAYQRGLDAGLPQNALTVRQLDEPSRVEAFDAACFGGSRHALISHCAALNPGRLFAVTQPNGEVDGYVVAQEAIIGPWVARSLAIAESLLHQALALPYSEQPWVFAPEGNADATGLLARCGFEPRYSLRHMRKGGSGPVAQRTTLYGQASTAVG